MSREYSEAVEAVRRAGALAGLSSFLRDAPIVDLLDAALPALTAMADRVEALTEGLEWYAVKGRYWSHTMNGVYEEAATFTDRGATARAALAAAQRGENKNTGGAPRPDDGDPT